MTDKGAGVAVVWIKAGVDISRLRRDVRRGLGICGAVYRRYGFEICVTSTYEGNHGDGSLHYSNDAFDLGLPTARVNAVAAECRDRLGVDYDVVLDVDHIHVEYDPKGG